MEYLILVFSFCPQLQFCVVRVDGTARGCGGECLVGFGCPFGVFRREEIFEGLVALVWRPSKSLVYRNIPYVLLLASSCDNISLYDFAKLF